MEQIGTKHRTVAMKEVVQITHIVLVAEEDGKEVELILASNRRTLPVPYSEEP